MVPGKSLSTAQNYVFCFREPYLHYVKQNEKSTYTIKIENMIEKVLRRFTNGRNMRGRWWTSPTIEDLLSDV